MAKTAQILTIASAVGLLLILPAWKALAAIAAGVLALAQAVPQWRLALALIGITGLAVIATVVLPFSGVRLTFGSSPPQPDLRLMLISPARQLQEELEIADYVNGVRLAAGQRPLVRDAQLSDAAKAAAERDAVTLTLRHINFNADISAGASMVGEDIGWTQGSWRVVALDWLQTTRRPILLERRFSRIGTGVAILADGTTWIHAILASPAHVQGFSHDRRAGGATRALRSGPFNPEAPS